MKLRVYFPENSRITEGTVIYNAHSFNVEEDGHLYIYTNSMDAYGMHQTLAVYAPGFWSTIENIDELDKQ